MAKSEFDKIFDALNYAQQKAIDNEWKILASSINVIMGTMHSQKDGEELNDLIIEKFVMKKLGMEGFNDNSR